MVEALRITLDFLSVRWPVTAAIPCGDCCRSPRRSPQPALQFGLAPASSCSMRSHQVHLRQVNNVGALVVIPGRRPVIARWRWLRRRRCATNCTDRTADQRACGCAPAATGQAADRTAGTRAEHATAYGALPDFAGAFVRPASRAAPAFAWRLPPAHPRQSCGLDCGPAERALQKVLLCQHVDLILWRLLQEPTATSALRPAPSAP